MEKYIFVELWSKVELGWKACRDLEKMCQDHWRWQSQNPYGYRKKEDAK